jgi:glycine oxidase
MMAEREELKLWEKADGFSAQWLKSEEVHRLESRFSQDVKGGILLEEVGMLDSYRYTLALAQAAEHYGAEIMHGEAVGLKSTGNRITGVRLKSGAIACDAVVVALGPWSGQVSSWLGLDIPVQPLKGQILYLEAPDPPLKYHVHGPCSFVHKADNLVWVGATEERADFDTHTTVEARDYLIHRALKMMPYLGQLRLVQQTACLRPVTPDSRPIIGKAPGWDGVYLATGAAKKGILLSPGIGRSTADLITKGETSLPIEPFAPERFTSPD